jgi:hypothetical protein
MPQRTPDQAGYNLATEVLTRKVVFTGEEQEYFFDLRVRVWVFFEAAYD